MGLFLESKGARSLLLDPLLAEATLAVNDVLGAKMLDFALFFLFSVTRKC